jgi:RimJ/RimL family protein N-acetyltransferase
MQFPLLTERLSIRPLSLEDVDTFVEYRQDPAVARFQSWEPSYSRDDALSLISSQVGVNHPAEGEWLQLAIHLRASGEHVGDLALHTLANDESAFELGFTIASPHQGLGYAREAATRFIQYLFSDVAAQKIIAMTDSRNASSIALLRALGFEHRPSHRFSEEFKGELVDVDYFENFRV